MRTPEFYLSEEWLNEVTNRSSKYMFLFREIYDKPYSTYVNAVINICFLEYMRTKVCECFSPVITIFENSPEYREFIREKIERAISHAISSGVSIPLVKEKKISKKARILYKAWFVILVLASLNCAYHKFHSLFSSENKISHSRNVSFE